MFKPRLPERKPDRTQWQFGMRPMLAVMTLLAAVAASGVPQRIVDRWRVVTADQAIRSYNDGIDVWVTLLVISVVSISVAVAVFAANRSYAILMSLWIAAAALGLLMVCIPTPGGIADFLVFMAGAVALGLASGWTARLVDERRSLDGRA